MSDPSASGDGPRRQGRSLFASSLEDLVPGDLDGIDRVVCSRTGSAGHIEVICRIRGIAIESPQNTPSVAAHENVNVDGRPYWVSTDSVGLQISAYELRDLDGINLRAISSIFLRCEHLLYSETAVGRLAGATDFGWRNRLFRE